MTNEPTPPDATEGSDGEEAVDDEVLLDLYDLDGDGKVSAVEGIRADLGVLDAQLEQKAEEGGVTGKIADAAHHVVDKFDND